MAARTNNPWGVGFLTWALTRATLDTALAHGSAAIMLSFGDPSPFADIIRGSGARLIVQVTDLDEARQALDVGADLIVAQGSEPAGTGADPSATDLVSSIVAEAETALAHAIAPR